MKAVKYKENLRPSSGPGHVRRPGYADGLMGLSVARSKFRRTPEDSR